MNNDNNNNDNYDINNQLLINNYITYSREYMIMTQNLMNNLSRNDDRIYNLIYSNWLNRSSVSTNINSSQTNNNQPFSNASFNDILHIPVSTNRNDLRNDTRTRRTNSSSNNNTRNVRQRQNVNRGRPQTTTGFDRTVGSDIRIPITDNRNQIRETNTPFNSISRDLTDIFESAINNVEWVTNLEPVPVAPTQAQISMACEDISFNQIVNPINGSCPINLERFTDNSTVTQIIYCGHCYSPNALRRWFTSNVRCPICRYDIRTYNPLTTINNPYRRMTYSNIFSPERPPPPPNELNNSSRENNAEEEKNDESISDLIYDLSNVNIGSGNVVYSDISNNESIIDVSYQIFLNSN